jgi:HSP20 family protein
MSQRLRRWETYLDNRAGAEVRWRPAADVYQTCDSWILKFDLAGVKLDDILIEAHGSRIFLSEMRRDWVLEGVCSCYLMEISYNRFERIIELPSDLEGARLDSEIQDGILMVRITNTRR